MTIFWYNGELINGENITLKITDPGLIYGATVFTTLRVYKQSLNHPLTHWGLHKQRLSNSLQVFGWQLPDWERIQQGAEVLLSNYPVLRIAVFADGREWITGRSLPPDLAARQQNGIIAILPDDLILGRSLAEHKTGNYLSAHLALQKAQKLGAQEAILTDYLGNWLETATGNLWGWKKGCWYTPALSENILPGIGRGYILKQLKFHNIPVEENRWTSNFVEDLEVIAYSNSVVQIVPIKSILSNNKNFELNPFHPALKDLQEIYFPWR